MAEFYERRDRQFESLWERRLLDREIARDVYGAHSVSGLRQGGWEHLHRLSEMAEASDAGCLLRRDGAESGTAPEDESSDPDDHGTIRRSSASRLHLIQATHAARGDRRESKPVLEPWTVTP